MSKRAREEQDDDEPASPAKPPPPPPTLLDARNISPVELWDDSVRYTGRVVDIIWDRNKFKFAIHHDTNKPTFEDVMTLTDPFTLMPTLSVLLNLELRVHLASMSVVGVLAVRKSTTTLFAHKKPFKRAKIKEMSARVGRDLGPHIELKHPHETHTSRFKVGNPVQRLLDNYFTLSPPDGDKVVQACKYYPLATALRTPRSFLCVAAEEERWSPAFRSLVVPPGPVDPMRITALLKKLDKPDDELNEIVQSAMLYQQFARDRHRLWAAASEVPEFMKRHNLMLPDQENPNRCAPWCLLPLIAQFRNWVRGDVVSANYMPHKTTWVQYDRDICGENGLQHQLMRNNVPVVTLYPDASVKGAFEGFAGFSTTPPTENSAQCVVLVPYIDTWTVYDFASAVKRISHVQPLAVFFHGNPRVDSELMTELRNGCRSVYALERNASLPPWHLPDPVLGQFVHEPPSSLPPHNCELSDAYPAAKGSITYLSRSEENEKQLLAWYFTMRAKANMAKQPFAVQVFVPNKVCQNKWNALANPRKHVVPGIKLLDANGLMHVVRKVHGPSYTSSYPSIGTTAEPACLYRGHASWLSTQTYSLSYVNHNACCSHTGYALPSCDMFHVGLHAHEIMLAEALMPHQCHLPLVRMGILYIPTFHGITQELLDFVFVAMARVLDHVVVYGPSREEFVAALS